MELFTLIFLVLAVFLSIKIFALLFKAGAFLILLPIKIILYVLLSLTVLIFLPFLIIPALLGIFLPLLPLVILGFGIMLLLKYV